MIVSATPNKEHKPRRRAQKKKGCATPQQKQWKCARHTTGTLELRNTHCQFQCPCQCPCQCQLRCQCKFQFCNKGRNDSEFLRSSWSLLGALSRGLRDASMCTSSSILLFFWHSIALKDRCVVAYLVIRRSCGNRIMSARALDQARVNEPDKPPTTTVLSCPLQAENKHIGAATSFGIRFHFGVVFAFLRVFGFHIVRCVLFSYQLFNCVFFCNGKFVFPPCCVLLAKRCRRNLVS